MLVALAIGWAMVFPGLDAFGQNQQPGKAKVIKTTGPASYSRKGGPFIPLRANTYLLAGDVIRTGDNASVDLSLLKNNGAIQIDANSVLALDQLVFSSAGQEVIHDTQLDLKKGKVYGRVTKMSPQSRYQVKTPRAVAGIRGTAYEINADTGVITVTEGTVIVVIVTTGPTGETITTPYTVNAGQTFDASAAAGQQVRPATPVEQQQLQQRIPNLDTIINEQLGGPPPPGAVVVPFVPTDPVKVAQDQNQDNPGKQDPTSGDVTPPAEPPAEEPTPTS